MIPLKELQVKEVVQLTQDNMMDLMRFWSRFTNDIQVIDGENCFRVQSSLPHPLFNHILKTISPDNSEYFIKTLIQDYKNMHVPFLWRVWEHDTPQNLGEKLKEFGGEQIRSTSLMALDIDNFQPLSDPIPELIIKPVRNKFDSKRFTKCCSTAFEIPEFLSETLTEIWSKQHVNLEHYVGYVNGTAVATATIFYSNGVAGIYNVATLPEFQGKGIGVEMMTAILLIAKLEGYKTAVLHSTLVGLRLYERLGFQSYGEMRQYLFL
ncbi:GNAT family N-acetyltransferase [Neobacillus sp. LXY-1]|uniref:GNAT family N-acetyltransferase n=1 Tax=Neobacillus sp. LXY-1 TaxID=3379133 RepID=UPI003EE37CBB